MFTQLAPFQLKNCPDCAELTATLERFSKLTVLLDAPRDIGEEFPITIELFANCALVIEPTIFAEFTLKYDGTINIEPEVALVITTPTCME